MPTPWFRRVKAAKELTVFNKAGAWSTVATKAIATFNGLNFPVKLTATTDERNANIVVKLSKGPDSQTSWGQTANTGDDFDPTILHGLTITIVEVNERRHTSEISFAAIFLPGKVKATDDQKEVIIVHEFIHACGLNGDPSKPRKDNDQDHEGTGIMYDIMFTDGNGLIEGSRPKDVAAMPPIRVGQRTRTKLESIWATEAARAN